MAAPSFLVIAAKDPAGANLDRVQIVKGGLDTQGEARERVFDVVWSADRQPGASGTLAAALLFKKKKKTVYCRREVAFETLFHTLRVHTLVADVEGVLVSMQLTLTHPPAFRMS